MEFLNTLAASPALFISCCVVLGLLVGSFLNVVIYRIPIMMENDLRAECAALAESEAPPAASMEATDAPLEAPPVVQSEMPLDVPGDSSNQAPTEGPIEAPLDAQSDASPAAPPVFNLVTPPSSCPKCKAPISAVQNIPVVSWLALGGKCANCKAPISARYPLVELATAVLSGFIAWRFGFWGFTIAALVFTWVLIALTMIDFDTQYLPDSLTFSLLWLGLIVSLWHPAWGTGAAAVSPRESIIGAVAGYLSLWAVYWAFKLLTGKEGMGYGDFKLFAALGAWLGWQMLLPVMVFASGVGAVFGIVIMIRQHKGRDTQLAFGPFLAIAGWLGMVAGHAFVARYLAFFAVAD